MPVPPLFRHNERTVHSEWSMVVVIRDRWFVVAGIVAGIVPRHNPSYAFRHENGVVEHAVNPCEVTAS